LINAVLQAIPIISSLSPFTAVGPLGFVLAVSMLREGYEDYVTFLLVRKGIQKIGKLTLAKPKFLETDSLRKSNGIR